VFGGKPTPINLTPVERDIAGATFDAYAHSITAYEASPDVSLFSSKFDAFLAGNTTLTVDEKAGYDLFRGKANCNSCHLDGRGVTRTSDLSDNSNASDVGPFFTDTTSANLGLPRNPAVPFYYESTRDPLGFTPNPAGVDFTDLGVGRFLRGASGTNPNARGSRSGPSARAT
jgi:cytochrome c peroxidase